MAEPRLQYSGLVRIDDIDCSGRLRPVSEKAVASLIDSINELGVMQDAVHVRKKRSGQMVLLKGAHRVEAGRRLGWTEIEAKVWTGVTDDWSRLMEIDDNLAGAELAPLDKAIFLAERKRTYEKLHPETRAQVAGGLARQGAAAELGSAAAVMAEALGVSERQVRKIAAAGAALSRDEIRWLRDAPRPVSLKDLEVLAKIDTDRERSQVCIDLSNGSAKKAAEARRLYAARRGDQPPPKDPVEEGFKGLMKDWDRAPMAARRRFIAAISGEIDALREGEDG